MSNGTSGPLGWTPTKRPHSVNGAVVTAPWPAVPDAEPTPAAPAPPTEATTTPVPPAPAESLHEVRPDAEPTPAAPAPPTEATTSVPPASAEVPHEAPPAEPMVLDTADAEMRAVPVPPVERAPRRAATPSAEPTAAADPVLAMIDAILSGKAEETGSEASEEPGEEPTEAPVRARKKRGRKNREAPAEDDFYVPRPGMRLRGGRGLALGSKFAILGTVLVLAVGAVGVSAYTAGATASSRGATAITTEAATDWHLDQYNVAAASSWGATFLETCLARRSDGTDSARRASAANYVSGNPDPACGTGDSKSELTVSSVTYAGLATIVEGVPTARFVSFDVTYGDGRVIRAVTPINLTNPATGEGPRVIGHTGIVPVPALGAAPTGNPADTQVNDATLASNLQAQYLPDVFTAWAASSTSLSQFLTGDASASARAGLGGFLGQPKVGAVTVAVPKELVPTSGGFTYPDGSKVTATVNVAFTSTTYPASAAAYRVALVRVGGHWLVNDIAAGDVLLGSGTGSVPEPSRAPTATPSPTSTP